MHSAVQTEQVRPTFSTCFCTTGVLHKDNNELSHTGVPAHHSRDNCVETFQTTKMWKVSSQFSELEQRVSREARRLRSCATKAGYEVHVCF
jgi:hypothetical protein